MSKIGRNKKLMLGNLKFSNPDSDKNLYFHAIISVFLEH